MSKQIADVRNDISNRDYEKAANELTQLLAARCQPEPMLLLMRSFCNQQRNMSSSGALGQALDDAKKLLKLVPAWPYSYLQMGLVLIDLKKYKEAEEMLYQALWLSESQNLKSQLDSHLVFVRLLWLLTSNPALDEADAFLAAKLNPTIEQADDWLKKNVRGDEFILDAIEALPDVESDVSSREEARSEVETVASRSPRDQLEVSTPKSVEVEDDCSEEFSDDELLSPLEAVARFRDYSKVVEYPTNLMALNGVFITNVKPNISEAIIQQIFIRYGLLEKIINKANRFFVHYNNYQSPVRAMAELQGFDDPDYCLDNLKWRVRFAPSEEQYTAFWMKTRQAYEKQMRGMGECPYWRCGVGCPDGYRCRYKHLVVNYDVDTLHDPSKSTRKFEKLFKQEDAFFV